MPDVAHTIKHEFTSNFQRVQIQTEFHFLFQRQVFNIYKHKIFKEYPLADWFLIAAQNMDK